MQLAEKMSQIGTESAFEVLARARALEAQGKNIIHLEIGEPAFDRPPHVVEAGARRLRAGHTPYLPAGAPRGPHPRLPGPGPARAARGGGGTSLEVARGGGRPGPRAGGARGEV